MTSHEWIEKARRDKLKLLSLVQSFHPASKGMVETEMVVTAPDAEIACEVVRERIKLKEKNLLPPVIRFIEALDTGDISEITTILNSAWFGVPESTSCWRIEGFSEAVDLLEDPPDD